jgi:hypothetical protein
VLGLGSCIIGWRLGDNSGHGLLSAFDGVSCIQGDAGGPYHPLLDFKHGCTSFRYILKIFRSEARSVDTE